jgi:hypothetical protein
LIKELGLRVYNVQPIPQDFKGFYDRPVDIFSERVAVVESNLETCIPTNMVANTEVSAFFTVKYGEGDFIISLIFMTHARHSQEAKNTIKNAILKVTNEKITKKMNNS